MVRAWNGSAYVLGLAVNETGNPCIGTTKPGAKLEVSDPFIRTIARTYGNGWDDG